MENVFNVFKPTIKQCFCLNPWTSTNEKLFFTIYEPIAGKRGLTNGLSYVTVL